MPGFKKLEAKGADRQEVKMPAMSRRITRHGGQQDPEHREKEHTMKQRRGRHQKASGYWRGEEGSR